MKIEEFEDIEAWKEARELVKEIYHYFASNKGYSFRDQIHRAAVSIMSNIAEGFSRKGNKEFTQFLFISKSSAAELQSHVYIALDLKYIDQEGFDSLYTQAEKIQRMLSNLIKYLRSTHRTQQSQ